jgi:predicted lipid-binding transport protein (Tim44 family)
MTLDVITIVALVVAAVVFMRLRGVVGRRTDDDEARIERYRSQRSAQQQSAPKDGKVVTLPRREAVPAEANVRENTADRDLRMTKFAGGNAQIARGLIDIAGKDASFDPAEFMKGARAAYEMIVMGFAEGNRNLLNDLLSPDVFSGFAQAIHTREEARQKVEQSFVGITSADMVEAELSGGHAQVSVRFVSELISAVRDQGGEVVSGDPKKIKEVTDLWTFARDVGARDPNWRLVATQAAS